MFEVVQNRYGEVSNNPTEAQRTSLKNAKKKDYKTLFYIHQSVDSNNFEKNLKNNKM